MEIKETDTSIKKKRIRRPSKKQGMQVKPQAVPAVEPQPVAAATPVEAPSPAITASTPTVTVPKKKQLLNYLLAGCGIVVLALAVAAGYFWATAGRNVVLAALCIIFFAAGVLIIYKAFATNGGTVNNAVFIPEAPTAKTDGANRIAAAGTNGELPNSLNIYATLINGKPVTQKVAFEWVEHPVGQLQQCTNDEKWYHVHLFDLKTSKLIPFLLPDTAYFDPREFANVIKMPAHRRLFTHKQSLLQQFAPAIMLIACVIGWLALVAVG